MDELLDGGIDAAAAALARGAVSARELAQACLARIAARDGALNCFLSVEAVSALARAEELDRLRRSGCVLGALHGIPVARKDLFDRPGRVASCGAVRTGAGPAKTTATCIARLDAAGAVDLGALNMSEYAFHPHGLNALAGPARNPWDSARTAGGSSGGSAAVLAARLVFGSMGSDSGGSIRHPSALCGVVGLLPTRGRISRHGMMRSSPSLDAAGPMARTVRDCALLFAAVAGRDPLDAETVDVPFAPEAGARGLADRVIARPSADQLASVSAEARLAFEQAAATLRSHGAEIVEIALPEWDALNALTAIVFASEVAATHRRRLADDPGAYSPEVRERMAAGFAYPATDYFDALRVRARMTRSFTAAIFARAEALLLPSAPDTAPRLDEVLPGAAVRRYDAGAYTLATAADPGRFTRALNYLGLPALALPAGFSGEGLPLGVQLVGRPFGEAALFAIGEAFQQATDYHRRRPTVEAAHDVRSHMSNI